MWMWWLRRKTNPWYGWALYLMRNIRHLSSPWKLKKTSLKNFKVTTTFVNLKLKQKDKESLSGTLAEALAVRERSPNQKRENVVDRNRNHDMTIVVWLMINVYFVNKLVIERRIFPSLRRRTSWRKSQKNYQRWMSPSQMGMNLILLLSHSLSHHRYVTWMLRSGIGHGGYLSHMSQEGMVL